MKKAFLACLTCLGVLFACTPEEGGSVTGGLTVDVDKIEATTDGGEFNVKVTCGVATTTTITYLEGGENWITLMPKVLKGNGTLKFTLGKYLEYDATRTATATIEGTGVKLLGLQKATLLGVQFRMVQQQVSVSSRSLFLSLRTISTEQQRLL